jgi:hypothetical protein
MYSLTSTLDGGEHLISWSSYNALRKRALLPVGFEAVWATEYL